MEFLLNDEIIACLA